MGEAIQLVIRAVVVSAIVLLCCYLWKHKTRASIEYTDKSMDATVFPEGGYSVNTAIFKVSDVKPGDFVAYKIPKDPATVRIGRVIGTEGMRVEVTPKEVKANGIPLTKKIENGTWTMPEIKVPRGCLYILADNTTVSIDSKLMGPIPFHFVLGTVKP